MIHCDYFCYDHDTVVVLLALALLLLYYDVCIFII